MDYCDGDTNVTYIPLLLTLCDNDNSTEYVILFLRSSTICSFFVIPIWLWLT